VALVVKALNLELTSREPNHVPLCTASVILIGCADDLVVSDTGWEHSACSVRGHRHLCALAP